MQPDDRSLFATLLSSVMAYYQRETSDFLLNVFWSGLRAFEFDDVRRAFELHVCAPDQGKFAPRVADITLLLEGSTQTQGMRAWAKVEAAMKTVGAYRSVVFDDPLIHAVIVEMGGWVPLCRCGVEDLPFRAREFERRYGSYRLRRETPAFPARLMGENEASNRHNGHIGYEVRPVLIGEPERAALVLQRGNATGALRITDARHLAQDVMAKLLPPGKESAA